MMWAKKRNISTTVSVMISSSITGAAWLRHTGVVFIMLAGQVGDPSLLAFSSHQGPQVMEKHEWRATLPYPGDRKKKGSCGLPFGPHRVVFYCSRCLFYLCV